MCKVLAWFDLVFLTFLENSNHGRENYWKYGVQIPAPRGQIFFVLFSFLFQILHTKLGGSQKLVIFDFNHFLISCLEIKWNMLLKKAEKMGKIGGIHDIQRMWINFNAKKAKNLGKIGGSNGSIKFAFFGIFWPCTPLVGIFYVANYTFLWPPTHPKFKRNLWKAPFFTAVYIWERFIITWIFFHLKSP